MIHFVIIHVTLFLIVAFFVFFAASKAEGFLAIFGRILGGWLLLLAVLHVVVTFVPGIIPGFGPGTFRGPMMHGPWHDWQTPAQPATPKP